MKISLRRALELAVGPANVDAAGHAVADWFDGHNFIDAAELVREALRDQLGEPGAYFVPHNRPDTSLRAELLQKLATQREAILSLYDRVDRLEMRADGLTPIERVQRRWAKKSTGGDKLDRLIAQDRADEPTVPDGREPASVVEEPSDRDLRQLYADTFDLRSDPASLGPAIVKFARAVLARWGHHPAPVPVSERLPEPSDCDEQGRCWLFSKVEEKWSLIDASNPEAPHLQYCCSHWLPANALPLPAGEPNQGESNV